MYIDDRTRVRHMIDSATEAIEFAKDRSRTDLDTDRMLCLAILKSIENVGEGAYRTSRNFRDANREVDWRTLIELRHSLVHDYFDVDAEAVWNAVTTELPSLIGLLEKIVSP